MSVIRDTSVWRLAGAIVLAMAAATPARAGEPLPRPTGEIILTLSGNLGRTNTPTGAAEFDRAMLDALPHAGFVTSTPWTNGPTRFDGVPIGDLLAYVEAQGKVLTITALNDYSAKVPAADAEHGAILADKVDGAYFQVREKGPLWLIYPFDSAHELQREKFYGRSVWQIRWIFVSDVAGD